MPFRGRLWLGVAVGVFAVAATVFPTRSYAVDESRVRAVCDWMIETDRMKSMGECMSYFQEDIKNACQQLKDRGYPSDWAKNQGECMRHFKATQK